LGYYQYGGLRFDPTGSRGSGFDFDFGFDEAEVGLVLELGSAFVSGSGSKSGFDFDFGSDSGPGSELEPATEVWVVGQDEYLADSSEMAGIVVDWTKGSMGHSKALR
jgi:hypothetical protein